MQGSHTRLESNDEYTHWKSELALDEESELGKNPIAYWLTKEGQYPLLAKFALNILAIPASSADCERMFSELGDLLEVRQLCMLPDLLSALQAIRSWKRLGLKPSTELSPFTRKEPVKPPNPPQESQESTMYYLPEFV